MALKKKQVLEKNTLKNRGIIKKTNIPTKTVPMKKSAPINKAPNKRPILKSQQSSPAKLTRTMSIEISCDDDYVKRRPTFKQRFVKFLRIVLIFFYGQFFANAIYTHLIHGVPLVQASPSSFYPNLKVGLGIFMVIHTLFSVMVIWNRNWFLILGSVISLIILSCVTLITSIIDLTQRKERGVLVEHEFGSTIAEIVIEFVFRTFAVIFSLLMVKFIRDIHGLNIEDDEDGESLEDKSDMKKDIELKDIEVDDEDEENEDENVDENDEEDDEGDDEKTGLKK